MNLDDGRCNTEDVDRSAPRARKPRDAIRVGQPAAGFGRPTGRSAVGRGLPVFSRRPTRFSAWLAGPAGRPPRGAADRAEPRAPGCAPLETRTCVNLRRACRPPRWETAAICTLLSLWYR